MIPDTTILFYPIKRSPQQSKLREATHTLLRSALICYAANIVGSTLL